MNQPEWKPAGHRRGVERAGTVIVAVAAALAAVVAIGLACLLAVYGLA
ncbi:hypothetical protein ACFV0H_15650 [Streptomyces erythrochromogenes]|uniref:Uncharacterized protein n=1 Tax=Streptomyces erythrochromogenes TaxID=285574 RepID=A0ABZ1QLU7_9ACTN|nr:hypothetical protein [Streptomyces erythrochromogenes]MCX5589018.1 hypothetical protein [Streptomyces erythrochromogenes]